MICSKGKIGEPGDELDEISLKKKTFQRDGPIVGC